jgi:CheY-like chemotaxis protein
MTNEKLEILVVEDKELNQKSARWLLRDHNVDVVGDYDQAIRMLVGVEDGESTPRDLSGRTSKYGVVLSDLMFPLGGNGMPCRDTLREQPLGYSLAFIASRLQVPEVAILTAMNHHDGPIAATFDFMYGEQDRRRPVFEIGNTRLMMFDERDVGSAYLKEDGSITIECPYDLPKSERGGFVSKGEVLFETAKNWASALKILRHGYRDRGE